MIITTSNSQRTRINHLTMRWHGPTRDARTPAHALRLENLLGQADWCPHTLKPSEILLIRRLLVPAALNLKAFTLQGWGAALTATLDDVYRRAIRPGSATVLAHADALLFEDAAELLVCLTREVLTASETTSVFLVRSWYWQQLLKAEWPTTPGPMLAALWSQYAAHLPAAFADMSAHEIYQSIWLLNSADTQRVLHNVVSSYQWPLPPSIFANWANAFHEVEPHRRNRVAPWVEWMTPMPAMSRGRQLMPGVCALLHHAPTYAQSARCIRQLATWWSAPNTDADSQPNMRSTPAPNLLAATPPPDVRTAASPSPFGIGLETTHAAKLPAMGQLTSHADPSATSAQRLTQDMNQHSAVACAASEMPPVMERSLRSRTEDSATEIDRSVLDAPATNRSTQNAQKRPRNTDIATGLGGVLFLINVLKRLKLPDDLDESVSGWDLIAALAWSLLGTLAQTPDYLNDPIWPLFSNLAHAHRGANAQGTAHDDKAFAFLNFLSLDSNTPSAQGVTDWLTAGVAYVNRCWANMTANNAADEADHAVKPMTSTADMLAQRVLCKAGHVATSRTHIDLYLPPTAADIRLRLVGLDRDPGWIPELGYIIQFHFEETALT